MRSQVVLRAQMSALLLIILISAAGPLHAESGVTLTLDPAQAGITVPDDFCGVSFETARMLPDEGRRIFTPDNTALMAVFKSLGIRHLRVGGNTVDRETVPIPSLEDHDLLFKFARGAGVKVTLAVRMKGTEPSVVVPIARHVAQNFGDQLSAIAIGNEPDVYFKEYSQYKEAVQKLMAAINDPAVAPKALFTGPCSTPKAAVWAREFAKDFGPTHKIHSIAQHAYPGASARKVPSAAEGRARMLSREWLLGYQEFHDIFAPATVEQGLPLCLEEANSYYHGGLEGASDTFTSALWVLDYLHWWAAKGAAGLYLHTNDRAGGGARPAYYSTFIHSADGYAVQPIGYGIKAFDLGGHGRVVPVVVGNVDDLNLTAYAMASEGRLAVTLINKEYGDKARAASVTISAGEGFRKARAIHLTAPEGDIAATSGVSLGGSSFGALGEWNGTWEELPAAPGKRAVRVAPASAAVVELLP